MEPEPVDDLILDYSDVPLVVFTRPDHTRVLPWTMDEIRSPKYVQASLEDRIVTNPER